MCRLISIWKIKGQKLAKEKAQGGNMFLSVMYGSKKTDWKTISMRNWALILFFFLEWKSYPISNYLVGISQFSERAFWVNWLQCTFFNIFIPLQSWLDQRPALSSYYLSYTFLRWFQIWRCDDNTQYSPATILFIKLGSSPRTKRPESLKIICPI